MTDVGKVWLVGAGPGTPELLTVKGRELLERATVVLYDAVAQAPLLEACRSDALLLTAERQARAMTLQRMLDYARQGHQVVRLLTGDPEGYAEATAAVRALKQAGLAYGVVPGLLLPGRDAPLALTAFDSGALFGKRLLLPRPLEQARVSAQSIRLHGAIPVIFPLIAIEEPEDLAAVKAAILRLRSYDWVLLTSANGAEKLIAAVRRAGLDARAFGATKIGVIGPKTAEPLTRFGLVPDVVADEYVAEGLLLALPARSTMKRVLLFRAAEAREVLPEALRAAGIEVDVVAGYRTRRLSAAEAEPLRQLLREGQLDAVLVTSSSMATSLVEALGDEAQALLGQTLVASIGPVTTDTLEGLGVQAPVVAQKYTVDGLLSALEAELALRVAGKP